MRVIEEGFGSPLKSVSTRAAAHTFQKPIDEGQRASADEPQLRHSKITNYMGIDKREGLVTIAKRLLRST